MSSFRALIEYLFGFCHVKWIENVVSTSQSSQAVDVYHALFKE